MTTLVVYTGEYREDVIVPSYSRVEYIYVHPLLECSFLIFIKYMTGW